MDDASHETSRAESGIGILGLLLVRIIVPVWILAGALFKFASRDPSLLPKQFRAMLHGVELDLKIALAILLGIEFAAVAIMLFVPRLARLMAVIMLSAFVLVLVNEIIAGNIANCGCLGSFSPPPWLMLAIDIALLILVIAIRPATVTPRSAVRLGWTQASIVFLVASVVAFAWVLDRPTVVTSTLNTNTTSQAAPSTPTGSPGGEPETGNTPGATDAGTTPPTNTAGRMPPRDWYELDVSDWVGRNVRDIDLVQYTRGLPDNLEEGDQYLIYYSRTCDHCHMLLDFEFGFGVPVPTTLVAVPETPEGFSADGVMDNPCLDCQAAELPVGVNWILTPPVVMAIRDGEVICVKETEDAEAPECLMFH